MESKSNFLRNALFSVCVLALGYGAYRTYTYVHRDDLPELPYPELDEARKAGKFTKLVGSAYTRTALPGEIENPFAPQFANPAGVPPLSPINEGAPIYLGSFFRISETGALSGQTVGNFFIDFEVGGEFIIEDARTNYARDEHTIAIIMKHGRMRIKPYDYDQGKFTLLIRTPFTTILARRPELGIEIGGDGHGRIWPMNGEAIAIGPDGQHRKLNIKGLNRL
ncbi:MAG: hypothetical protein ACXWPM_12990 [Bdellovibrionota bacterium]